MEDEIKVIESKVPKEYHFGDKTKKAVKKIEGKYVELKEKREEFKEKKKEKKLQKKAEKDEKRAEHLFVNNLAKIDDI